MKNVFSLIRYRGFLISVFYFLFSGNLMHAQWVQSGLNGLFVRTITVTGANIFVGTSGDGIFRSGNNGLSWTPVNSGLTNLYVYAFAVSGSNLFAGTEGDGVFLSTNNGASWSSTGILTNPYVYALTVSGTVVYAGTDGDGVFRSTNNGVSWISSSSGITNLRIMNLTVSGTNLFSGTFGTGGIYRSSNNGSNWSAANNGLTNYDVWNIAVSGSNLFAGTGAGVFISTNNGTDWNSASSGLTDTYVHSIVFSNQNTFAGTDIDGVFRSTNNGASWIAVNEGLIKTSIWALGVSGSYLFAGSNGDGIYKRPLSELINGQSFTLDLKALIAGFYDPVTDKMVKDSAVIYLRNNTSPFSKIDSARAMLDSSGRGNFSFSNALNSVPYFIVVKHRNGLETWSAAGSSFNNGSLSYDFTTSDSQAFGNNLIQKGSKFCIYNGEINQDGMIDLSDIVSVYNDASNFQTGYIITDLTGDMFVDLSDLTTVSNSSAYFAHLIRP